MLSLPLPRSGYYLGKLLGYALIAVVTAVPLCCLLLFLAPGGVALLWGASLMLELLLVCAVSLAAGEHLQLVRFFGERGIEVSERIVRSINVTRRVSATS